MSSRKFGREEKRMEERVSLVRKEIEQETERKLVRYWNQQTMLGVALLVAGCGSACVGVTTS